jgi:DNA polymerase I-like protein with 3'-5' exonuclease and polymerase domains
VKADYSQMELRIRAQLSDDPAMIEAFENASCAPANYMLM